MEEDSVVRLPRPGGRSADDPLLSMCATVPDAC